MRCDTLFFQLFVCASLDFTWVVLFVERKCLHVLLNLRHSKRSSSLPLGSQMLETPPESLKGMALVPPQEVEEDP